MPPPQQGRPAQHIIAVGSGKGGVGKSTVAANLALAIQARGHKTVFVDADLYGPSVPTLFGVSDEERPQLKDQQTIIPIEKHGLKMMSIGFLIPSDDAVIWRGPMLAKMVQQFLQQVDWGKPEFMVIDLPPGTGDIQLTLTQIISLSGAVIVTTPQDLALADVKRAVHMFEKMQVPLLGVVENMSHFECPECKTQHDIFGAAGKRDWQELFKTDLLGQLPLETATRASGDSGTPLLLSSPESPQSQRFLDLADQVISRVKKLAEEADALSLPSLGNLTA